jgi:hypothetical protein
MGDREPSTVRSKTLTGASDAPTAIGALKRPRGCDHRRSMTLTRIAWLLTVAISLLVALLVLLAGYTGYAVLGVAIAASAAINLT